MLCEVWSNYVRDCAFWNSKTCHITQYMIFFWFPFTHICISWFMTPAWISLTFFYSFIFFIFIYFSLSSPAVTAFLKTWYRQLPLTGPKSREWKLMQCQHELLVNNCWNTASMDSHEEVLHKNCTSIPTNSDAKCYNSSYCIYSCGNLSVKWTL